MACNISLILKGENPISVLEGVEQSTSLDTILETISNWNKEDIENLKNKLENAQVIDYSTVIGEGKWLIGTTSFPELRKLFPEELSDLEDNNYNITLLDEAIIAGQKLKRRVLINNKILYIFSNKEDVRQFARTEKLNKYILEYLEDFPEEIKIISKSYNKTPKELLIDFVYNKSKYYKDIKNKLIVYQELNNFCRLLLNELIYFNESETKFAAYINLINTNKNKFGKLDLYKAFSEFFPNFSKEYSELNFIDMSVDEMNELFSKYLKNDLIMSSYSVISVGKTVATKHVLTIDELNKLYKSILNPENLSLKEALKRKYEFFPKIIEINGKTVDLLINDKDIWYETIELNNNNIITLKNNRRSVSQIFGYDTLNCYLPVNSDLVSEKGEYKGYYLYKVDDKIVISNSVIHPNLYPYKICNSVKEAIKIIDSTKSKIKTSLKKELKTKFIRKVKLPFQVVEGQVISSLDYHIPSYKLLPDLNDLINKGTIEDVINYYNDPNLNKLSAEELGVFIYMKSTSDKTNLEIINDIKSLNVKYYLVDKVLENNEVLLTSILESDIYNKGTKFLGTETNFKNLVIYSQLYKLKEYFEKNIFKDTSVKILIYNTKQIESLSDNGKQLILDASKIKAFVHNNSIYINSDNASYEDLIHETLHIMFGVSKINGIYEDTIKSFYEAGYYDKYLLNSENSEYKNLAYIDRLEEAIVNYLSKEIYGTNPLNNDNDLKVISKNILSLFYNVYSKIKKEINKKSNNDLFFQTTLSKLSEDDLSKMTLNRIITNIIEKAIEQRKIIEKCK